MPKKTKVGTKDLRAIAEALQKLERDNSFIWQPDGNCNNFRRLLFTAASELDAGNELTAKETLTLALRLYGWWMASKTMSDRIRQSVEAMNIPVTLNQLLEQGNAAPARKK